MIWLADLLWVASAKRLIIYNDSANILAAQCSR